MGCAPRSDGRSRTCDAVCSSAQLKRTSRRQGVKMKFCVCAAPRGADEDGISIGRALSAIGSLVARSYVEVLA